jgi:hypothetical protein
MKGVRDMLANKMIAVLAVSVGLVFAAAFAVQAYSPDEGTFAPIFYTGKIVGIDPAYKTLIVQADPKDEAYFTVTDRASLVVCGSEVDFKDLKVGETVTVRFFTESLGGNRLITDLRDEMKC